MKKNIIFILAIGLCGYFFIQSRSVKKDIPSSQIDDIKQATLSKANLKASAAVAVTGAKARAEDSQSPATVISTTAVTKNEVKKNLTAPIHNEPLLFVVEDGLAVIQGDIVLGEAITADGGQAAEPALQLWPSAEIPFYIQPTLQNPERVKEALTYFNGTAVRFVPLTNQSDAIVFEPGSTNCKSYLGRVGGHQPIWISGGCSAKEIAHEIMHALGFVHEQNRTDRDNFITVNWPNVDPKFKNNFEKLSKSLMVASEAAAFDFESIMIYPPTMFSVNGQPTLMPVLSSKLISPGRNLSDRDVSRINSLF